MNSFCTLMLSYLLSSSLLFSTTLYSMEAKVRSKKEGSSSFTIDYLQTIQVNIPVQQARFSPNGKVFFTLSQDGVVKLWDTATGKFLKEFLGVGTVFEVAVFGPNEDAILIGSKDGITRLYDTVTGQLLKEFTPHLVEREASFISALDVTKDGSSFVAGSKDGIVRVWSISQEKLLKELKGHTKIINSVLFSPNEAMILSASIDKTARVWNVKTGKIISILSGHTGPLTCAAWSPHNKLVATGSTDGTLRIWDAKKGKTKLEILLTPSKETVKSVAFSPDGSLILVGLWNKKVYLLDSQTGSLVQELPQRHTNSITTVSFNQDGTLILTASLDGSVILWALNSADQRSGL